MGPKNVGRLAATHATHACVMCHFEKLFDKTKRRRAANVLEIEDVARPISRG